MLSRFRTTVVPADLDPLQNGPPSPNPLANMNLWGSLFASGFGLPSRIWTPRVFYHCNVLYFEYCTESVLNRHKSHLIYFKNRTKIFRSPNRRFLDQRIPSNFMIYNFSATWVYFYDLGMCETEKRMKPSQVYILLLAIAICSDS